MKKMFCKKDRVACRGENANNTVVYRSGIVFPSYHI